ncbi:hypothetical protein K6W40_13230, partial [Acetobacter senegalensis]|nr:hypothetical protein [Acetobacter senegalensis]
SSTQSPQEVWNHRYALKTMGFLEPSTFKPRRYGESKLDFGVILNLLKFIARMKVKKVLGGIS